MFGTTAETGGAPAVAGEAGMRGRAAPGTAARALRCLAACLLVLGLAACGGGGDRAALDPGMGPNGQGRDGNRAGRERPSVKVALLLPLSAQGNTADVAKALKQAGELALFDFDDPDVTLMTKDTKGSAEGARAAAEAAVSDGAELIIGPLFAKSVKAAAPAAREAGIPVIAFSSDRSVAGDGVYLLSFLAGSDVPRIVDFAVSRGKRRFAALIPEGGYGDVAEKAFRAAVRDEGGELVALERLPKDANGMMEPTKRVAGLATSSEDSAQPPRVDALFIPAGPESLPTIAALIPYYEIDTEQVQLLGTGLWDYSNIGKEEPLEGGWYPGPDPKGWRSFTQDYVETYDETPPRLASLAYDAVSLAVSLSGNPPGERYTREQLTRASGFSGVDGLFRLRRDGTSQRGLAILEVQRFDSRVIDPAPDSFSTAQY